MTWTAGIDFEDAALETIEPVLGDIISAVNERCLAAKVSVLSEDLVLYSIGDITNAIDTKITALMALYADHTQANWGSGTGYSGLSTIPAWTEDNMLTAISESERIAGELYATTSWVKQVYKIINNLLWVRAEGGSAILPTPGAVGKIRWVLNKNTWAEVVSAWASSTYFTSFTQRIIGRFGIYDGKYDGQMFATNYTCHTDSSLEYFADLYFYTQADTGSYTPTYDDEGKGSQLQEDLYGSPFMQLGEASGAQRLFDIETYLNNDTTWGVPPQPGTVPVGVTKGWIATGGTAAPLTPPRVVVLRFDGTNGFTYK